VVAGAGAPSCPKCHKLELIRLLLLRAFSDMDDANPTKFVQLFLNWVGLMGIVVE
jgi:hypothetical protein